MAHQIHDPGDDPPSECNCFAIRSAARHVSQLYDQLLAPSGLRTTQYSILWRLKRRGPLTINALAAEMVMDRTTLGRNIRPIERDGLLVIEPDPADGRAKQLRLTKAGEKRVQAARKLWLGAQARFEGAYGASRAADLRGLLQAVVAIGLDGNAKERETPDAARQDPRTGRPLRRGPAR